MSKKGKPAGQPVLPLAAQIAGPQSTSFATAKAKFDAEHLTSKDAACIVRGTRRCGGSNDLSSASSA
jgi:hypothetical protein